MALAFESGTICDGVQQHCRRADRGQLGGVPLYPKNQFCRERRVFDPLWLYFIGGLYGNYEDCHIKADVLSMFVKRESSLRLFGILTKGISLAISIALAVWAYQYLGFCIKAGGYTNVFHIPMLCSRGALVVGYIAPVLYNVYHFVLALTGDQGTAAVAGGDKA